MAISAVLTLEHRGRVVPLARTRHPEVLRTVAEAVLRDLESASTAEEDEIISALLTQEISRVRQALCLLGLAPTKEVGNAKR